MLIKNQVQPEQNKNKCLGILGIHKKWVKELRNSENVLAKKANPIAEGVSSAGCVSKHSTRATVEVFQHVFIETFR